jgi:hypothetical protein
MWVKIKVSFMDELQILSLLLGDDRSNSSVTVTVGLLVTAVIIKCWWEGGGGAAVG